MASEINLDGQRFEIVDHFKCLRSLLTSKNEMSEEIRGRIIAGNRYYSLKQIFKSKTVSRIAKIKTYKTILKPIVMFGSETWT